MTIMIPLSPDEERRLAERAAQSGQDVEGFLHRLIERELQGPATLNPPALLREQFPRNPIEDRNRDGTDNASDPSAE